MRARHAGPAIAGARRQTWRCASARTRAFELQQGCAAWLPSARRPGTPLRRRCPALMQARPARSKYPAPRLKPRDISTAVSHVAQILSGRCVRPKIGAPPTPNPSLLRGPAVFERFRRRARSRWTAPRYPVRHSRADTSSSLVRADGVLLERAAGPLSRCPSTLVMIPAAINTYSSRATSSGRKKTLAVPFCRLLTNARARDADIPGHTSKFGVLSYLGDRRANTASTRPRERSYRLRTLPDAYQLIAIFTRAL